MAMNFGGNWAMLGHGMGQGLGQGLNESLDRSLQLIQQKKINDLKLQYGIDEQDAQKKYNKKQLSSLLGNQYDPGVLDFLASMPQQQQHAILSTPGALAQLHGLTQGQLGSGMQQLMQPQQQMPQQQPQMSPMDMLSMINGQQPQNPMMAGLQQQPQMPQINPQPGQAMQYRQPIQQGISPLQQAFRGGKGIAATTPHQQEMENLAKQKRIDAQQKDLKPFLDKAQDAVVESGPILQDIQEMKSILARKGEDIRHPYVSALPEWAQDAYLNDADYARYRQKQNDLIVKLSHALKGNPTVYKMKSVEKAKISSNMPVEAQREILDDLETDMKRQFYILEFQNSLQDPQTGLYPSDVKTKVTKYRAAFNDPLRYPEYLPVGARYIDDNDNEFILKETSKGKKWEKFNG
jgi:hypothetical protein